MKKIIVLFVVCAMFLAIVPSSTKAYTLDEVSTQIGLLSQKVTELKTQLSTLAPATSSSVGVAHIDAFSSNIVGSSCLVVFYSSTGAVALSGKVDKTGTDCTEGTVAPVAVTKLSAIQQTMVASAVKNVQLNLIRKGYFQVNFDGIFGKTTADGLNSENISNPMGSKIDSTNQALATSPNPITPKDPTNKTVWWFGHADGTCRVWTLHDNGAWTFQDGTTVYNYQGTGASGACMTSRNVLFYNY